MNTSPCLLCGNERIIEVRVSLARWRDLKANPSMYGAIPRCIDRKACRERVEAMGDEWPVIDPGEYAYVPGL